MDHGASTQIYDHSAHGLFYSDIQDLVRKLITARYNNAVKETDLCLTPETTQKQVSLLCNHAILVSKILSK